MARQHWSQAIALMVALGLTAAADWQAGIYRRHEFSLTMERLVNNLETYPTRLLAQGVGLALGGTSRRLREVALGYVPRDDPGSVAVLRFVAEALHASNAFVVDRRGVIVAYHTRFGRSDSGRNLMFRPYVRHALEGRFSFYPAVGSSTRERGIYVASPLVSDETEHADVIGVVATKLDFSDVDNLLAEERGDFFLRAPEGVIFAATHHRVLFAADVPARDVEALRAERRTTGMFTENPPRLLSAQVDLAGVWRAQVNWADPEGPWTLLGLPPERFGLAPLEIAAAFAGFCLITFLVDAWLRQRRRREEDREQAARELAAYAHRIEAVAERRSRLARVSTRLQQAGSVAELGEAFLSAASDLLGAVQGSLYVPNPADPAILVFVAGYGVTPETGAPPRLALGQGLLGECALGKRRIEVSPPVPAFWRVRTGLGDADPALILLLPVLRDADLMGVLELALLSPPDAEGESRLEELMPLLALNLGILTARLFSQSRPPDAFAIVTPEEAP